MDESQKNELEAIERAQVRKAMSVGEVIMQNRVIRVLLSHQSKAPKLILTLCQEVQSLEIP